MLSIRGFVVLGTGLFLWVAARMVGSPTLHVVAAGVTLLPLVAWLFVRWSRYHLGVTRRLSATKVGLGHRVTVELEVENRSPATTSFLLFQDRVPAALGRSARMVLTGLPGRNSQRVHYTLACRSRGRFAIGPLSVSVTDPFSLTRLRLDFPETDELVVFPEVEDLLRGLSSPQGSGAGRSLSRLLMPTGDEFYTMRQYQIGDDLRRIHWPSVARRGHLMIRQDEAARRGNSAIFLDTRVSALGQSGEPGFERAVSAAASLVVLLSRSAFTIRLATADLRPTAGPEEAILEALASVHHSHAQSLASTLVPLRSVASGDATLVVVTAPPLPGEIATLSRVGAAFGPKTAVLVYPVDPATLPPEAQSEIEGRASVARLSLTRAGWEVFVIPPHGRLIDAWRANKTKPLAPTGSSR